MRIDSRCALISVLAASISGGSAPAQTVPPAMLPEVTVTSTRDKHPLLTQPGIDAVRARIIPGLGRSVFAGLEWRI
jgi:hypothetical protein